MIENKCTKKQKLTELELIKNMRDKRGIKFNLTTEKEAEIFMKSANYYFKVGSYRKNFSKTNGKYDNLDFAYLQDLAAIDVTLRRYLSNVALAVEHGLKVYILNLISNNFNEDGYTIVQEFRKIEPKSYGRTLSFLKSNTYLKGLYKKYRESPPVWVFIEVITFGDLSKFIEFYFSKYPNKTLKTIVSNLKFAKNIRNATAHSNPILINLFAKDNFLNRPTQSVVSEAHKMGIEKNFLSDIKIHDLTALFYLNKLLTTNIARKHFYEDGLQVIHRFNKHLEYYESVSTINKFKVIFSKMIDYQISK